MRLNLNLAVFKLLLGVFAITRAYVDDSFFALRVEI